MIKAFICETQLSSAEGSLESSRGAIRKTAILLRRPKQFLNGLATWHSFSAVTLSWRYPLTPRQLNASLLITQSLTKLFFIAGISNKAGLLAHTMSPPNSATMTSALSCWAWRKTRGIQAEKREGWVQVVIRPASTWSQVRDAPAYRWTRLSSMLPVPVVFIAATLRLQLSRLISLPVSTVLPDSADVAATIITGVVSCKVGDGLTASSRMLKTVVSLWQSRPKAVKPMDLSTARAWLEVLSWNKTPTMADSSAIQWSGRPWVTGSPP